MTRTRKLIISAGIAAAAVGGGAAIASAQQGSTPPDLDGAARAGLEAAGDGDVVSIEQDDDGTYEVEVRRADGTEVEVDLSATFEVLQVVEDRVEDDDLPVDETTRTRAAEAALGSVGDGTVVSVEADAVGYEVEVRHPDGTESDVRLDREFVVVLSERDDD